MSERILVVTTCDMCQNGSDQPALIDVWGIAEVRNRGIFAGSEIEAMSRGWVEAEYGLICPECAEEEAKQTEIDTLSGVDHGATAMEALGSVLTGGEGQDEPGV